MQAYIERYLKREVRAHRISQKQFTRKCKQYMHQQITISTLEIRLTKHNTNKITKMWAIHVNTHTHTRTHILILIVIVLKTNANIHQTTSLEKLHGCCDLEN